MKRLCIVLTLAFSAAVLGVGCEKKSPATTSAAPLDPGKTAPAGSAPPPPPPPALPDGSKPK